MTRILLSSVAAAAVLASAPAAWAQTEIQWWHAMPGNLGEAVNALAEGFNKSQTEYKVNPVFKGTYTETLTAAIAAFRAKQAPHIVQVFEVGTANMMAAKGAVYPVFQLMADAKEPFDPKAFVPPVTGYYSTSDGKLLSMPFNSSTPVLYWNKELLTKAGLDPNKPPTTWPELGEMAKKAVAAGAKCGFTPQWQTWTMIENSALGTTCPTRQRPTASAALDIELKFNDALRIKHIQTLADWSKDKTFVYGGREGKSTALFTAGDCAFHIASSATRVGIEKALGQDKFGIAMMPYSPDVIAKPQNSIIGGATLWVLQGKPAGRLQGRRQVPDLSVERPGAGQVAPGDGLRADHVAAAEITREGGLLQEEFPGRDVAVKELTLNPPTDNSKGLRIGNFSQIRDIVDEELEQVWSGKKDAKAALDEAVKRGNEQLKRFEAQNK